MVILILSRRDYENLLKPQQKFLSPCLVFGSFKKVSEWLSQHFSVFFLYFLCFYYLQRSDIRLLIQDFFSSFEILNPDNKPTIFCDLYVLSKEFDVQVCLQGCDAPLCQLLMALWMPLIFSSWAQSMHGFRFGFAWPWKIRLYMGERRVSVMRSQSYKYRYCQLNSLSFHLWTHREGFCKSHLRKHSRAFLSSKPTLGITPGNKLTTSLRSSSWDVLYQKCHLAVTELTFPCGFLR